MKHSYSNFIEHFQPETNHQPQNYPRTRITLQSVFSQSFQSSTPYTTPHVPHKVRRNAVSLRNIALERNASTKSRRGKRDSGPLTHKRDARPISQLAYWLRFRAWKRRSIGYHLYTRIDAIYGRRMRAWLYMWRLLCKSTGFTGFSERFGKEDMGCWVFGTMLGWKFALMVMKSLFGRVSLGGELYIII